MKKIIFIAVGVLFFSATAVFALDIAYPVQELGNCKNESECSVFCDDFSHLGQCINFAEKSGMMTEMEIKEAKLVLPFVQKLKCANEAACQVQCKKDENLMTCVELGYQLGEVSERDYALMKKTGGKGPGGCKLDECDAYCDSDAHLIECVDFAVQNGLMDASEAAIVKKTGTMGGPGGCRGRVDCDRFCAKPENTRVCLEFGAAHGLINPDEVEIVLGAGSTRKEDVDRYCNSSEAVYQKCLQMWIRNGVKNPEQIAKEKVIRAFAGKICGITTLDWGAIEGCINNFCSKDANAEECWRFEVSAGKRTQAEYDEWVRQREENERNERERFESNIQSEDSGGDNQEATN